MIYRLTCKMRVLTQLRQPTQFWDETRLPGSPRFGINSLVVGAASKTLILHVCVRVLLIEEMLHLLRQSFAYRKMSASAAPEVCPSMSALAHTVRVRIFAIEELSAPIYRPRWLPKDSRPMFCGCFTGAQLKRKIETRLGRYDLIWLYHMIRSWWSKITLRNGFVFGECLCPKEIRTTKIFLRLRVKTRQNTSISLKTKSESCEESKSALG